MNVSIGQEVKLTARADNWAWFFRSDLLTFGAAFAALHAKKRGIPCSWVIAELRKVRQEELDGIMAMLETAEYDYLLMLDRAEQASIEH